MNAPTARVAVLLTALLVTLATGCGSVIPKPMPLAPALFPALDNAASRDPMLLALVLEQPGQKFRSASMRHFPGQVELPIGRIVEAAGMLALRRDFAAVVAEPQEPEAWAWRVMVSDIAFDLRSDLVYLVPLPCIPIMRVDVTARLSFAVHDPSAAPWSPDLS